MAAKEYQVSFETSFNNTLIEWELECNYNVGEGFVERAYLHKMWLGDIGIEFGDYPSIVIGYTWSVSELHITKLDEIENLYALKLLEIGKKAAIDMLVGSDKDKDPDDEMWF